MSHLRWKEVSLVKQKALNSLNPVMKIGHQLSMPFSYHLGLDNKESELKAKELLDLVNIDQLYFDSFPHELSGGMRQRVIIAIALALRPKLVIMDEPTTALDTVNEHQIINSIQKLQEKLGFSIVFITHDLNLLLQFADSICVLFDGEVVDFGSASKIKSGGSHEYTRTLINAIPKINLDKDKSKSGEMILSLNNINVKYQLGSWLFPEILHAVNDVSFNLYERHITSLIGESGSGKSTIAKVISGIEKNDSGDISLSSDRDKKVDFNLDYRKDVQMIFQDPFSALNPIHSVFHHFERPLKRFGFSSDRDIWDKACELLSLVELKSPDKFLTKYPHEMSGGECQRVCIARALVPSPKLIIADEPTSMLDVSIRSDILNLFVKLKETYGTSILLITHDIASASICSDYMVVLKGGKVVESGISNELLAKPSHDYTKSLIEASNRNWYKKNNKEKR